MCITRLKLNIFLQSKVTDVIQSSADDTDWSDDEHISTQERLSIEIGSIHSTDPPFEEEYDVPSDSGSSIEGAEYEKTYFSHQVIIHEIFKVVL